MKFVTVFVCTKSSDNYVYIDVDGESGQRKLAEYLIVLGHQRIAFVTPRQYLTFSQLRRQGFQETVATHDLLVLPQYVTEGDLSEASGYQAAALLFTLPSPSHRYYDWQSTGAARRAAHSGLDRSRIERVTPP